MPDSTLSILQSASKGEPRSRLTFHHGIKPAPMPKKPTVPDMKKVAKLLEGMGKQVTGINCHSNGFTVTASTPGPNPASEQNEWDEVLPHGKA